MVHSSRLQLLLLLSTILPLLVAAAKPASFCKCTCFGTNSTIIKLNSEPPPFSGFHKRLSEPDLLAPRDDDHDGEEKEHNEGDEIDGKPDDGNEDDRRMRSLNCNDCNRKLCMDYDLLVCRGAEEKDISTSCFQRDSGKDQAVVYLFILMTVGLLIWALIKPYVDKYVQHARDRSRYLPVTNQEPQEN